MLYQNYLKEFWSTVVAYDPSSLIDESEQCPLREFLIKFLVLNGQRPLTLDFNTLCSSTGLDYKNGKYVAPPTYESIVVAYDPSPLIDESEQGPLREFLIKFSVLNGKRPLTRDFNTFCSSTGLDYKNGKYVAPPTPEVVKKELSKIAINASYMDKTSV
ncbi:hypothetical protein Tco_1144376 [Tanacetum coccineum]